MEYLVDVDPCKAARHRSQWCSKRVTHLQFVFFATGGASQS